MKMLPSLWIALSTYSKLPAPHVDFTDENRKYAMAFFPAVGLAVGAVSLAFLWLADALSLSPLVTGAFLCLIPLCVTGGIHMDGFMDTCDAMASWQTRERRLEILHDSHVGAFAVMGLAGYLIAQWALMSEMRLGRAAAAWVLGFVLSRAVSALMLLWLPGARPGGMLAGFRESAQKKAVVRALLATIALTVLVMAVLSPFAAALMALACALSAAWYKRMAMKHFGGVTGDLAGCFLQVCELGMALAALIGGKLPW